MLLTTLVDFFVNLGHTKYLICEFYGFRDFVSSYTDFFNQLFFFQFIMLKIHTSNVLLMETNSSGEFHI